ncbi:hypothetical protein GOBAR_AA20101 [Gossypium barbadense]|uniref:Uncharacterized protein n=2 Tax=Gossypium TaxID=3633 RepID=A0ABR0PWB9_GOSAR|nr:hypothetical protein PVK06_015076 [Gossypium arboreum]PPS00542.1 hypothetical protein GOBAR_AA20101 [Gossypium barbadense]
MMISWSPPPLGWLKVNSNGALEVETAMATSGGAIRDYRGQWLVGFARNIGHATVTDAELWWCSSLKKKLLMSLCQNPTLPSDESGAKCWSYKYEASSHIATYLPGRGQWMITKIHGLG